MSWERFVQIERDLGIRRTIVLMVTLWLTWRSYEWAAQFAYVAMVKADTQTMLAAGGLIAAVTAPISYLLKAVLESYISSKGGGDGAPSISAKP